MDIVLTEGYTDTKQVTHRNVTFGTRLTGGMLFEIDEDPQSEIQTQHKLLMVRATITAFGTLPMPVPLEVLLKLDGAVEIKDLLDAHNKFMREGLEGRAPEFVSDSKVKLAIGYEANGLTYNQVEFGKRLNGFDLVEADKTGFASLRREYFLIGREITKLSTEDGQYTLDGPVEIQMIEKLDAEDFVTLRLAAVRWRESFRAAKQKVPRDSGESGAAVSPELQVESP